MSKKANIDACVPNLRKPKNMGYYRLMSRKQKLGRFGEIFIKFMDDIEAEGKSVGINLTVICKEAKVSRAGPVRWRERVPATIRLMDQMARVVAKYKEKAAKAA